MIEHTNQYEQPKTAIELAQQLENSEDVEYIRENLGTLLDLIELETGARFETEADTIYKNMERENCLVRVEQLSRILKTVELDDDLPIGHNAETHYANAVIPDERGIKLALAEGQAPGPIRVLMSFGKSLIGFKTDNLQVTEVDYVPDAAGIRDEQERRYVCRHVEGTLKKQDIKFLVIRIPKHLLDEQHLTQEELEEKDFPFVFRATHF
jgi:transcriptional antiterminator Rof (Rho-off)